MKFVYCLQTWIEARTITGSAFWHWDLNDLFLSQHEAETVRVEFFSDERTRIVRMELIEGDVIDEFLSNDDLVASVGQKLLF